MFSIRSACSVLLGPGLAFVCGCGQPATPTPSTGQDKAVSSVAGEDHHYLHQQEKPHAAEWSYEGRTGPAYWGDLCPDYVLAKNGKAQSPVDLTGFAIEELDAIQFDYRPAPLNLVYNGHTIQETDDDGSSITVADRTFRLRQFHFHAPSEHTVEGQSFAMEMHLVHQDDAGRVAVVGVLIQEGEENEAFRPIWDYLPTEKNRRLQYEARVDVAALLPDERSYFHYSGSFTTPPCTEGVEWYVLEHPVELSAAQIGKFKAIISGNNRPVQPLNGRRVVLEK